VSKAIFGVCAALLAALTIGVPAASPAPHMLVGLLDEAHTLYGNPDQTFPILQKLRVQVLRIDLYWGGKFGVAQSRPTDATDPSDPAYDWSAYDRTAQYAHQYGVKLLLTIWGTPGWANGGKGLRTAPKSFSDLQKFAYAAATRYSGTYIGDDGRTLPAVKMWTAWNEPNQPFQLWPQFVKKGGKWVIQSAVDYAKICNSIYTGIHSTMLSGEQVACGVTAPGGNNIAGRARPSISPLTFLAAAKKAGMKKFDAYAHHPYPRRPSETPTTHPAKNAVTLANIGDLEKAVKQLYGAKPIWITEYGYQTNPPDKKLGVSWAKQALYMKEAYAKARKDPRIRVMLWFLLKDEPVLGGWQSGLMTASGKKKPAFTTFMNLPH
jgi:Glycosyl hydrolase catalytic core